MKELLSRLNKETFIFDLNDPIKELPNLDDYNLKLVDTTTIEVEVDRERNINKLFEILTKKNINITSMRNKTSRLEELFLKLLTNKD